MARCVLTYKREGYLWTAWLLPVCFQYTLSQETIDYLKQPTFDIWHWEPNEVRQTKPWFLVAPSLSCVHPVVCLSMAEPPFLTWFLGHSGNFKQLLFFAKTFFNSQNFFEFCFLAFLDAHAILNILPVSLLFAFFRCSMQFWVLKTKFCFQPNFFTLPKKQCSCSKHTRLLLSTAGEARQKHSQSFSQVAFPESHLETHNVHQKQKSCLKDHAHILRRFTNNTSFLSCCKWK